MNRRRERKGSGPSSRAKFYVVSLSRRRPWVVGLLAVVVAAGLWFGWTSSGGEPARWTFGGGPAADVGGGENFEGRDGAAPEPEAAPVLSDVTVVVGPEPSPGAVREHPFDLLRMERERHRSREAETWMHVVADGERSREARDAAARRLDELWAASQRETEIEHLLAAEGYRAAAMATDGAVHVVVDAPLDAAAATRIGELVARVAGVRREAVTIVDSISSEG